MPQQLGPNSSINQEIREPETFSSQEGLTHLSPSIGQLTNLQELDVTGNQLTELPEAIGRLTNRVRSVPPEESRRDWQQSAFENLPSWPPYGCPRTL